MTELDPTDRKNAEMASFQLKRLSDYSNAAIQKEILRVADATGDSPLTIDLFMQHSKISAATIRRRFGSWMSALELCGLGERLSANANGRLSDFSKAQIEEEIRAIYQKNGGRPVEVRHIDKYCSFSSDWVRKEYGIPVRKLLEELGVPVSKSGNSFTNQECLENLLTVWTHYGRQPKYLEMNLPPSTVGAKAYLRFGTWMRALERLVEGDESEKISKDPETKKGLEIDTTEANAGEIPKQPQSARRETSLSLRFEVLYRDNFKCVLCGNSPATDPSCKLHVDHILPFSLGGLTVAENLRSLCEKCNLGRSNRFVD